MSQLTKNYGRQQSSFQPRSQPAKRAWLGLVTCLPVTGRLQTNDLGEGWISVKFVSGECRCKVQPSNSVRISGCYSIRDTFLFKYWHVQRKSQIHLVCIQKLFTQWYSYRSKHTGLELPFLCCTCKGHIRKQN